MSWDFLTPALLNFAGTAIASNANRQGADAAGAATIQGAQIQADAIRQAQEQTQAAADYARTVTQGAADNARATNQYYSDRAREDLTAGNDAAIAKWGELETQTAPGATYLRQVVADPGALTPLQQQTLEDSRLATTNMLHNSNFAGSGRAGVELLKRSESDTLNNMIEANRNRSMNAATTLAGQNFQAGQGVATTKQNQGQQSAGIDMQTGTNNANITIGAGNNLAGITTNAGNNVAAMTSNIGKVQGDAEAKSGLYGAQADIANGNLMGRAIGDVGSMIATEKRESRYADRLSKIEKSMGLN